MYRNPGASFIAAIIDNLVAQGRIRPEDLEEIMHHPRLFCQRLEAITRLAPDQPLDQAALAALGYPRGFVIKPIQQQLDEWKAILPQLRLPPANWLDIQVHTVLPKRAEGLVALPDPRYFSKNYNYRDATLAMLDLLGKKVPVDFNRINEFVSKKHTRIQRESLSESARILVTDFLVFPVQLGSGGVNMTSTEAQERIYFQNGHPIVEFMLGLYEVAGILVTHDRLAEERDLKIVTADGAHPNNDHLNTLLSIGRTRQGLHCLHTMIPDTMHGFATGFHLRPPRSQPF